MSIVDATSYISIINSSLPSFVSGFANIFFRIHQIWKGYKRTQEITESASNFGLSCAGWAVDLCVGDFNIVKVTARGVSIARKTVECVKQQKHFVARYKELTEAFSEEILDPKERIISNGLKFISPSTRASIKSCLNALAERIVLIFERMSQFFSSLFLLSMSFISILEELRNKKEITQEAVKALFLNINFFFQEVKAHEKEIHATLTSLGAKYNVSVITNTASCGVSLLKAAGNLITSAQELFKPPETNETKIRSVSVSKILEPRYHPTVS